mgnify:CR=1 FL=1
MTGTGIIDQFLETFTRYIDNGFGLLGSDVGYLATTLAAIDITLAASVLFHQFWAAPADQAFVQQLLFMKNLSVAGGLFIVAALGAGSFSFDARRQPALASA